MTVALSVLVGALALSSRQSPPPTIAEFAPRAVEQITDAARGQSASAGAGADSRLQDDVDPATGRRRDVGSVDVARVRQCVGDPPRQIEDPQSPPCVPYWEGDNGGATSRGVTRDEVRVADTAFNQARSGALQAFFNRRFEFYGRRIRFIPRAVPGNPAGDRAAARAAYEQDQVFASYGWAGRYHYFDELARLGVISVEVSPFFSESYLASRRPYLWTYSMANDRLFALAGNWYCARFAGRNAVYAGDPTRRLARRKPGIILTGAEEGTSPEPVNAQLASCGEHAQAETHTTIGFSDQVGYEGTILRMKASGVTTLACLCDLLSLGLLARIATKQGYFPEWLVTSYFPGVDTNDFKRWSQAPPEQKVMGLTVFPMQRPFAEHPSTWAMNEAANMQPAHGQDQIWFDNAYHALLPLVAGLQMAGPHLTPETFERGLHGARFPNPPHPIMAGGVGFTDGDHSMTDDAAEEWWSPTAQSPYLDEGLGSYCYVDHGARRTLGRFPSGDEPFFKAPCDSGAG